jgi:transposase
MTTGVRLAAARADILRLHFVEGMSTRAIARKLQLSRKTIRKALGRGLPPKSAAPRTRMLDPYRDAVSAMLKDAPELRAPAVLERLRILGFPGSVTIVRDLLQRLRPATSREPFSTLDFPPGKALQVDWADFGFAIPGCPRRVSAFVMVLCYSRKLYIEFRLSQSQGSLLRCMERGLRFFGGSTLIDIFDNMKTVVLSHTPTATIFHPRFLQYAAARGFAAIACNPGKGNEKGRVERPIKFVRDRFWPGRRFRDLVDLNAQAAVWRDDFANNRVHEVTGKVPSLVFEHEERRLLKALPETTFNTDDVFGTGVTKTFRVSFDRNRYSVPWRLVSQSVVVRGNDETVAVFLGPKQVAIHSRSWDIGQEIKHPSHEQGVLDRKPRAAAATLPPALVGLGDVGRQYFKVFAAGSRSIHREAVRLTFLVELFGESATRSAIEEVMKTGHVGAEYIEYVLRYKRGLEPAVAPLRLGQPELDAISLREPDMSVYDDLAKPPMTRDPGDVPDEDVEVGESGLAE